MALPEAKLDQKVLDPATVSHVEYEFSKVPVGDIELHVKTWKVPEGTTQRSVILFNHGFGDNSNQYDDFAPYLALKGHKVVLYDQRGAGLTSPPEQYGLTNEKYVMQDLDGMIEHITKDYDGPLILSGMSMGGGITHSYQIVGKYRERIAMFMGIAPLVEVHPNTRPNFLLWNAIPYIASIWPSYRQRAPISKGFLSHNEEWVQKMMIDRDLRIMCSAGQMNDMIQRGQRLLDPEFTAKAVDRPVAVFHSREDSINSFDSSAKFVENLSKQIKGPVVLYDYDDFYHCMTHETPDRVYKLFTDFTSFIDENLKA